MDANEVAIDIEKLNHLYDMITNLGLLEETYKMLN